MVNWIATKAVSLLALLAGFWRSFKLLKHGTVDYTILEFWAVVGVVQLLEYALEWLVSWVPFYYTGKILALLALCYPKSRVSGVLFDALVIPFMRFCHTTLSDPHFQARILDHLATVPFLLVELVAPGAALGPPPPKGAAEKRVRLGRVDSEEAFGGSISVDDLSAMDISSADLDEAADPKGAPRASDRHAKMSESDVSRLASTHNRLRHIASHHRAAKDGEPDGKESPPAPRGANGAKAKGPVAAAPRQTLSERLGVSVRPRRSSPGSMSAKGVESEGKDNGDAVAHRTRSRWQTTLGNGSLFGTSKAAGSDEEDDDEAEAPPPATMRRRSSIGDSVRELLTGDERVRIRDHLFDLSVSTPPLRTSYSGKVSSGSPKSGASPLPRRRSSGRGRFVSAQKDAK